MNVNGEPCAPRGARTVREGVGIPGLPHDLDIQVSKLRVLKQSYLSEHYDLEDRILKFYPQTIKEYEERIAGYESDTALAEQHKPQGEDKFCPMTLKGVTYVMKLYMNGGNGK